MRQEVDNPSCPDLLSEQAASNWPLSELDNWRRDAAENILRGDTAMLNEIGRKFKRGIMTFCSSIGKVERQDRLAKMTVCSFLALVTVN
jgi:hypothetical protein